MIGRVTEHEIETINLVFRYWIKGMTTRKAKIVATIGPASESEEMLEKLIRAGMNVARMNFSHGSHEQHAERIARLRKVSEALNISIGILQDLQGPKIRVGALGEPIQLEEGEEVTLFATGTTPPENGLKKIPVDFRQLFDSCRLSDRLLLDDHLGVGLHGTKVEVVLNAESQAEHQGEQEEQSSSKTFYEGWKSHICSVAPGFQ